MSVPETSANGSRPLAIESESLPSIPGEPHSELQRGLLGVALGVLLGAITLVFRRSGPDRG